MFCVLRSRQDADAIKAIARRQCIQTAVQIRVMFELESSGGKKIGSGLTNPVTRTSTEFGVLLICIITVFDG